MRNSAFEHFKNLYRDYNGVVICVDDAERILYCTDTAYDVFTIPRDTVSGINNILSSDCIRTLRGIIRDPRITSFECIVPSLTRACLCTLTPMLYNGIYYFALSFDIDGGNRLSDSTLSTELWCSINLPKLMRSLEILEAADKGENDIMRQNVLKIRKMLSHLDIIQNKFDVYKYEHPISLDSYINNFIDMISRRLGDDKIHIRYSDGNGLTLISIPYQCLDLLFCNVVTNIIHTYGYGVTVDISHMYTKNNNVIVISTDGILPQTRVDEQTKREYTLTFGVISKLLRTYGCDIKFDTSSASPSLIVIVPHDTVIEPRLYCPLEVTDYSIVDVQLSDI